MNTVIIYTSKHGFTRAVAEQISKMIEGNVDLIKVEDVRPDHIKKSDKIIFGSPIYSGKIQGHMADLINQYKKDLVDKSCAMYISSLNEFKTMSYLEQSLSKGFINNLLALVYVGYGLDYDKMNLVEKIAVKAMIKTNTSNESINKEALETLIVKLYDAKNV